MSVDSSSEWVGRRSAKAPRYLRTIRDFSLDETLGAGKPLRLAVSAISEGDAVQLSLGRMLPTLDEEQALWSGGYGRVAGVDEAGRGAWAGPVVAAAVVLPPDAGIARRLAGVADSKQLAARQREFLVAVVLAEAAGSGVGIVSATEIDAFGIAEANRLAMKLAIEALDTPPDYLLIDYLRLPSLATPQHSLPKGDSRVLSIAAASIVAKVTRDRLMVELACEHPGYGFERHKGYGTVDHRASLMRLGPCPIHRRSFEPVKSLQPAPSDESQLALGALG